VSAYVALGVGFYEQVEEAWLVVAGDGGVGADDLLGGVVVGGVGEGGGERDVLADGEAEDGGGGGEGEAVDGCVVGEDGLFFEGEGLEGRGVEDLFGFCMMKSAPGLEAVPASLCPLAECIRTASEHFVSSKRGSDERGVRKPFTLEDPCANQEKRRGNVHAVKVLRRQPIRGRHICND